MSDTKSLVVVLWVANLLLLGFGIAVGVAWVQQVMAVDEASFPIDEKKLAKAIKEHLTAHSEEIMQAAVGVAQETVPPLAEAMYQQMQQDYPAYLQALREQRGSYLENVEEMLLTQAKQEYRQYLQQHREVLAKKFPEYASSKAIDEFIARFESIGDKLIEKYYLDEFRREVDRTANAWEEIQTLPPAPKDEPSHQEQLGLYLSDWLVLNFSDRAKQQVFGSE